MSNARQLAANLPREGGLSNRNLIINGAMQVAQRGTSVTGITSSPGYTTVDRWQLATVIGTLTSEQSTDAPDGFSNSWKLSCTVAEPTASLNAGDYIQAYYSFEGQDLQRLGYGTPNAKPLTLSFWVKSSKTGTGTVELQQKDNSDRMVNPTYTINTANTWEYKTITIPADTSGQIDNDNNRSMWVLFWLQSGTTYTGGTNSTTWVAESNNNRNATNFEFATSTSDTWQITGVQLEVGTATPFEHRSYSDQLQACQRYYYKVANTSSAYYGTGYSDTNVMMIQSLPTVMRADPTVGYTSIGGSGTFAGDYSRADRITIYITDTNGAASIYGAYADAEL